MNEYQQITHRQCAEAAPSIDGTRLKKAYNVQRSST